MFGARFMSEFKSEFAEPAVDAVFVACTNLRIAETIHSLEKQLGKPVTSSNHAMAWHALHLAGLSHSQKGWGRLFDQT